MRIGDRVLESWVVLRFLDGGIGCVSVVVPWRRFREVAVMDSRVRVILGAAIDYDHIEDIVVVIKLN